MIKRKIDVDIDFSRKAGRVKPISAIVGGPLFSSFGTLDFSDEYKELSIPAVRLAPSMSGGGAYVELSRVFPDFSLDERFELSYDFGAADKFVLAARECGCDVFLSIGEPSDHWSLTPEKYLKWARVAAKVISHYNLGFASGYKLGIKYVELMSGADRSRIFSSGAEFGEFYRVAAGYIKSVLPRIKVGAYSSGGFRSLNHVDTSEVEKRYVTFLEDFLSYISKKETRAPLDFFSWQCHTDTPEELSLHNNYARSYLAHYGFKKAESIISEFNIYSAGDKITVNEGSYPALMASCLITAAKTDVTMMFYSDSHPYSKKNFLYTLDDRCEKRCYAAYRVMRAFGALSSLKASFADSSEDYRHEVYSISAQNDNEGYVLLATRSYDGIIELVPEGHSYTSYSIEGILGGGERGAGLSNCVDGLPLGDKISLRAGRHEVYFIVLHK